MSEMFIVRGSEYQSFLTCRKQWFYQYALGLEPKKPDNKLFFGTLFHKWLEFYYEHACSKEHADFAISTWYLKQDLSGMEQTEIDDLKHLFAGVTGYYHETCGQSDSQFKVLGTEVEFLVKLDDDFYMTGTIDLVYETPEGKVRFMDHKTVSSIQMYVEKAEMDRQISRYWWALKMLAAGIGRIKDEHGNWVRWNDLINKEIDGFDYNLIAKDFPKEPKVLKSGKLSVDKSQKTTWQLYSDKIVELGLMAADYWDILKYLHDKPNQFLQRVNVIRNDNELEAAVWEFLYTSGDMHDVALAIKTQPQAVDSLTYRNIGTHCQTMCVFKDICKTAIQGGNIELLLKMNYKTKEETK